MKYIDVTDNVNKQMHNEDNIIITKANYWCDTIGCIFKQKKVILWVYVNILYFDVEQGNEAKLLLCTLHMRFKKVQVITLDEKQWLFMLMNYN